MNEELKQNLYDVMAKCLILGNDSTSCYFLCNLILSLAIKYNDDRMVKFMVPLCASSLEKLYTDLRDSGKNHEFSMEISHQIPSLAKKVARFTEEDYNKSSKIIEAMIKEKGIENCNIEDIERDINITYDIEKSGNKATFIKKEVTKEEFDKFFNNTNNEDTSNEDDTSNN